MRWRAAWLAVLLLAGCAGTLAPVPELSGGCLPEASPYLAPHAGLASARISYCAQGDAATGRIETGEFPAGTTRLPVLLSGYPDVAGIRLLAVPSDGSRPLRLRVARVGDRWTPVLLELPPQLQGRAFRLRLDDDATGLFGWAGLGFASAGAPVNVAVLLLLFVAVALGHAWLSLAAAATPDAWSPAARGSAAIVVLGGAGLLVFVAYVVAPWPGRAGAVSLLLAPLLVAWRARGRGLGRDLLTLQPALAPAALLALLVLWIGLYPFHWTGADWQVPATRWRDLPMDNWLPLFLAQMFERGGIQNPLVGDWLSSDRPPLQAGLYLLFRDVLPGAPGLGYQGLSSWLQALVLVPLALLLPPRAGVSGRAGLLLMVAVSALAVVNTLFVWPKLFTASYCIVYHFMLFGAAGPPRGRIAALAGAVAGLALLAHGGCLFALVGSTVAFLLLKRTAGLRMLPAAAVGGAVVYLPWLLYQRLLDPPGDRLLKWHFAGQVEPTADSFATVFAAAWRATGAEGWLHGRVANLQLIVDGALRFFADAGRLALDPGNPALIARMVDSGFFATSYSAWFFSPAWLALLLPLAWRRRDRLPAGSGALALALVAGLLFWALAMFAPSSTVVHQGSHFLAIALQWLVAGLMLALAPRLFAAMLAGNVLVFLALYVFDRPLATLTWPALYAAVAMALLAALALACRAAAAPSGIIPASPASLPPTIPPN